MMAQINNEIKIAFPEEFQSDSTIQCHLSPEISAVDMEIRWFKETDCVCFYKNRRLIEGESYEGIMSLCIENLERGIVSLQLQDVRESHVGDYLCQVTSEDRTAEITIRKSSKSNDEVPQQTTKQWFIKSARTWTNEERIKMANSALLAVFNKLEKSDAPKEDLQGVIATVPQTDINVEENQEEAEEKNTQQVHKGRHMNDSMGFPENVMETSTCKLEEQKTHLGDQQPGFSSVPQTDINVEENQEEAEEKNTQQVHKGRHMNDSMGFPENVMETSTCKLEEQKTHLGDQQPGFSSAFNRLENTDAPKEDLQGVNATVPQTDINVEENREEAEEKNTQQVHKGRHMNDSMGFPENVMETSTCKLEEQKTHLGDQQPGFSSDVKMCIFRTGKTYGYDKNFTDMLQRRIGNLTEVSRVDESDIILVFCPVVSRAGTDIDTALERFSGKTDSKLAVLVVLHHTFDPEKTIPDSSRSVKRTDILTVDCLFYEDRGLLKCQKNSNAVDKTVNWLIQQGRQTGVKIRPRQNFTNPGQNRDQEHEALAKGNKRQKMGNNEPSTKKVKVFSILDEKMKSCQKKFFDILRNRIENLEEAHTGGESDIILVFCPIVSRAGTDIEAALKNCVYSTDSKLTVLVVLHHTFDPEKIVPDSSRSVKRTDILTVDCLFYEDTGLLECQKNLDSTEKTVNWLIQQGAKIGKTISPSQHESSASSGVISYLRKFRA